MFQGAVSALGYGRLARGLFDLAVEGADAAARLLRPASLFHWFLHLQQRSRSDARRPESNTDGANAYASFGLPGIATEMSHHLPSCSW